MGVVVGGGSVLSVIIYVCHVFCDHLVVRVVLLDNVGRLQPYRR